MGTSIHKCASEDAKMLSNVVHPDHYQTSSLECIDAIEAAVEGLYPKEAFLVGTAIKYLWRFKKKGKPVEDLNKAIWYINRLIDYELDQQGTQEGFNEPRN